MPPFKHNFSLLILIGAFATQAFTQEVSIPSTADTYILSSSPDESFWEDDRLRIKHTFSESNERHAWIKFNTQDFLNNPEQVILKLVKVSGNEGNVSLIGADPNFNANATWNNPPSDGDPFFFGGTRSGDTFLFDVTEYVDDQIQNGVSQIAFKIFTTSFIVSSISFGSSEAADSATIPELLFYSEQAYDLPLFNFHEDISIETNRGTFDANIYDVKPLPEQRSIYGGWLNAKSSSPGTGFFRTERDCEGTWHIIDPAGYMFYSAGINSVERGGSVSLPNDLKDLGLNTMGSWSDESVKDMAYCPRFNVLLRYKNSDDDIETTYDLDILPVFESSFPAFCQNLAEDQVTQYINDEWVLGYFLDNEMVFHRDHLTLSLTLLSIDNAQYQEAHNWMRQRHGDSYNLDDITDTDIAAYQGHVADTYFRIVTQAFRDVDPNHMLIGSRFHAGVKYIPEVFEAAGPYVDIVTVNYYNRFEPEEEVMEMWLEEAEKPFMITEFYTKGDDSGLGNEDGAGWTVPTQQDRADWFENWMLKLLRNKGNVGFHWFRYNDKIGNDSNKGLYTSDYELYVELGESISKISNSIYTMRSQILYGNVNYNDVIDCQLEICGDGIVDDPSDDIFGNCCPFELNVHQSEINSGIYKADNRINSEGQVNATDVEMRAGSEVNLSAGFEVAAGSIFHAHIAPCN